MLRRTNYGLLVDDDGKPNKNELAIDYIVESARSVGIEVIEGKTALDIQFMAEVMKRLREKQEPKTVHWIDHQDGRWIYAQCSECGTVHDTQTNYCPNCGAKMESEDKE